MLADDEKAHARILTDKLATGKCQLIDSDTLAQAKNIFSGLGDLHSDVKAYLSQLDFYRLALEKEQQSIDLYSRYSDLAKAPLEKELFDFLVKQEKHHYEVLDELVTLLAHAEEWVENAEFGRRKEY